MVCFSPLQHLCHASRLLPACRCLPHSSSRNLKCCQCCHQFVCLLFEPWSCYYFGYRCSMQSNRKKRRQPGRMSSGRVAQCRLCPVPCFLGILLCPALSTSDSDNCQLSPLSALGLARLRSSLCLRLRHLRTGHINNCTTVRVDANKWLPPTVPRSTLSSPHAGRNKLLPPRAESGWGAMRKEEVRFV